MRNYVHNVTEINCEILFSILEIGLLVALVNAKNSTVCTTLSLHIPHILFMGFIQSRDKKIVGHTNTFVED